MFTGISGQYPDESKYQYVAFTLIDILFLHQKIIHLFK